MIAYHGTNEDNFFNIHKNNFSESRGEHHFIGEGVYFFIEGIGDIPAIEFAEKWVIVHSYDKILKKNSFDRYIILEAKIIALPEKIWDISSTDGLKEFNYFRKIVYEKINCFQKKILDNDIINYAFNQLGFEVIIANVYIKFEQERKFKIESRLPNTTIMVVKNPKNNIEKDSIKIVKRGQIPVIGKGNYKNDFRRI